MYYSKWCLRNIHVRYIREVRRLARRGHGPNQDRLQAQPQKVNHTFFTNYIYTYMPISTSSFSEISCDFWNENFRFDFMALSDDRQRSMPSMADRDNAKQLAYKEAVLLTNPRNPMFKGEV